MKAVLHARFHGLVRIALLTTHVMVVASLWGRWRDIALVTGLNAGLAILNELLAHRHFPRHGHAIENARIALNAVGLCLMGHLSGWPAAVWILLPLNCLWREGAGDLATRARLSGLVGAVVGFALLEGAPPQGPLTLLVLCALIIGLSGTRLQALRLTLEQLARRHDELKQAMEELERAHCRAREQDRLSSLCMLAAGIAHEVNNPMSYVKSNLCALQTDLRAAQHALPPALREYVTEVLPQTLEGVQRVCAVVADLRRFARGDPEALVEYDLNEEVRSALRIMRGRTQAHCEVETALETLPSLLGHPRQISHVVSHLLVNASQATKQRGVVRVTTRMEGENDVVLTVRDTGEGMAPEVLARVLQSCSTPHPAGEGTGLGLAVVQGIVTAHGGQLQVESELGRGTTITVRLPRVPPLRLVTPRPVNESPDPAVPGDILSHVLRFH